MKKSLIYTLTALMILVTAFQTTMAEQKIHFHEWKVWASAKIKHDRVSLVMLKVGELGFTKPVNALQFMTRATERGLILVHPKTLDAVKELSVWDGAPLCVAVNPTHPSFIVGTDPCISGGAEIPTTWFKDGTEEVEFMPEAVWVFGLGGDVI